jgi:hypothetical protein
MFKSLFYELKNGEVMSRGDCSAWIESRVGEGRICSGFEFEVVIWGVGNWTEWSSLLQTFWRCFPKKESRSWISHKRDSLTNKIPCHDYWQTKWDTRRQTAACSTRTPTIFPLPHKLNSTIVRLISIWKLQKLPKTLHKNNNQHLNVKSLFYW